LTNFETCNQKLLATKQVFKRPLPKKVVLYPKVVIPMSLTTIEEDYIVMQGTAKTDLAVFLTEFMSQN
jgi:hypothetical protein